MKILDSRQLTYASFGALVGGLLVYLLYPYTLDYPQRRIVVTESVGVIATTSLMSSTSTSPSPPVTLRIPKIELEAGFEGPLGLNQDKTVEVPRTYDKLGWYRYGPMPGEVGSAVILGHVDSYKGPAVFYDLRLLVVGDKIYITKEDGTEVSFEVISIERYRQADFPTAMVYGEVPYPALRLVTCAGFFNKLRQEYSHNLVVYAKLSY